VLPPPGGCAGREHRRRAERAGSGGRPGPVRGLKGRGAGGRTQKSSTRLDVLHAGLLQRLAHVLRLRRRLRAPADHANLLDAAEGLRQQFVLVAAAAVDELWLAGKVHPLLLEHLGVKLEHGGCARLPPWRPVRAHRPAQLSCCTPAAQLQARRPRRAALASRRSLATHSALWRPHRPAPACLMSPYLSGRRCGERLRATAFAHTPSTSPRYPGFCLSTL
jgi:hypothetical protein